MKRQRLPNNAKIDWDHITLVSLYDENGREHLTFFSADRSTPKIDS